VIAAATEPAPELRDAFAHLARIRCFLHLNAKRDRNLLSFEAQDALAEHWREGDAAHWMRAFYRHARLPRATRQLEATEASRAASSRNSATAAAASPTPTSASRDRVLFREPHAIEHNPDLVPGFFEFVARHGVRPALDAEQQLVSRRARIREHAIQWPAFSRILSLPHAPLAVRWMHETGALSAMFPELEAIECLVVRDFYHRYTVDEHTIVAMQNLWGVNGAKGNPERDRTPAVLMFATLFHDAGKGLRGVRRARGLARQAMMRFACPRSTATCRVPDPAPSRPSTAMQSRDLFDRRPSAISPTRSRRWSGSRP
jgi:[protein-PII] uridylyltransferase